MTKTPEAILKEIEAVTDKIVALRKRQSSGKEWGWARAAHLKSAEDVRVRLQGELPPLRLVA